MNKKTLIIILVVIIILAVVDIGVYLLFLKPVPAPDQNVNLPTAEERQIAGPAPQEYEPSAALAGAYYQEKALEEKSLEPCLKIEDPRKKAGCLNEARGYLSATEATAEFCLAYPAADDRLNCVKFFAFEKNNPDHCNILVVPEAKEACLENYAMNKTLDGNPDICNLITNNEKKTECLDKAYMLTGECDKITDSEKKDACANELF